MALSYNNLIWYNSRCHENVLIYQLLKTRCCIGHFQIFRNWGPPPPFHHYHPVFFFKERSVVFHLFVSDKLNIEFFFQAWGLRGTQRWFLRCRGTTMCSDMAHCIPSTRTSPTDWWSSPPAWGNPRRLTSSRVMSRQSVSLHWAEVKDPLHCLTQQLNPHALPPSRDSSVASCKADARQRFSADCTTLTQTHHDFINLFLVSTLSSSLHTLVFRIISCLLLNSYSGRCELNTSPGLFYPSSLVLNGRNTTFVENCKLNRYLITTKAKGFFLNSTCCYLNWVKGTSVPAHLPFFNLCCPPFILCL